MSTEENKAIIQQWLERAWSQGDFSVLTASVAPDATIGLLNGAARPYNPAVAEQGIRRWRDCFSNYRYHKVELVAEGDTVVVCAAFTGTHTAPFTSGPRTIQATSHTIDVAEVIICRVRHGKIAEVRAVYDRLLLLEQLDATP